LPKTESVQDMPAVAIHRNRLISEPINRKRQKTGKSRRKILVNANTSQKRPPHRTIRARAVGSRLPVSSGGGTTVRPEEVPKPVSNLWAASGDLDRLSRHGDCIVAEDRVGPGGACRHDPPKQIHVGAEQQEETDSRKELTENLSQCEHLTEKGRRSGQSGLEQQVLDCLRCPAAAARQCARKKRPFLRASSGPSKEDRRKPYSDPDIVLSNVVPHFDLRSEPEQHRLRRADNWGRPLSITELNLEKAEKFLRSLGRPVRPHVLGGSFASSSSHPGGFRNTCSLNNPPPGLPVSSPITRSIESSHCPLLWISAPIENLLTSGYNGDRFKAWCFVPFLECRGGRSAARHFGSSCPGPSFGAHCEFSAGGCDR